MTIVWHLASGRHAPLTGEGARLVGGRWNSAGRPLVYASESLALCLAECLVHITGPLPRDYVAFQLAVPEDGIETLNATVLKADWRADLGYTRAIGDQWLAQERSLVLAVPSAVLPESTNMLLNPLHPGAGEVQIVDRQPFRFDPRLRPDRPRSGGTRRSAGQSRSEPHAHRGGGHHHGAGPRAGATPGDGSKRDTPDLMRL